MKYVSTRSSAGKVDAAQAIVAGLAPDGGLYVPESFPAFALSTALKSFASASLLAAAITAAMANRPFCTFAPRSGSQVLRPSGGVV